MTYTQLPGMQNSHLKSRCMRTTNGSPEWAWDLWRLCKLIHCGWRDYNEKASSLGGWGPIQSSWIPLDLSKVDGAIFGIYIYIYMPLHAIIYFATFSHLERWLYVDTTNSKEKGIIAYKRTWLRVCSLECLFLTKHLVWHRSWLERPQISILRVISYESTTNLQGVTSFMLDGWEVHLYVVITSRHNIPSHPIAMTLVQSVMVNYK